MMYLGLDLGQNPDPSALALLDPVLTEGHRINWLRHIQRFSLGTKYSEIGRRVKLLTMTRQVSQAGYRLVVDATGVGRPVYEEIRDLGIPAVGVMITAGDGYRLDTETGLWHVSKRHLVSIGQVLLQSGRLRFVSSLPEIDMLVQELLNFRIKITKAGNDTYEAWRTGQHDDMVLSVLLAAWLSETFAPAERQVNSVNPLANTEVL